MNLSLMVMLLKKDIFDLIDKHFQFIAVEHRKIIIIFNSINKPIQIYHYFIYFSNYLTIVNTCYY